MEAALVYKDELAQVEAERLSEPVQALLFTAFAGRYRLFLKVSRHAEAYGT